MVPETSGNLESKLSRSISHLNNILWHYYHKLLANSRYMQICQFYLLHLSTSPLSLNCVYICPNQYSMSRNSMFQSSNVKYHCLGASLNIMFPNDTLHPSSRLLFKPDIFNINMYRGPHIADTFRFPQNYISFSDSTL